VALLIAGPLADNLFEPAMREGGWLVGWMYWLVGSGPGAGISLIFVLTGLAGSLVGLAGYLVPFIRKAEDILSDHVVAAEEEKKEELEDTAPRRIHPPAAAAAAVELAAVQMGGGEDREGAVPPTAGIDLGLRRVTQPINPEHSVHLEHGYPGLQHLTYACVLAPRLPQHLLNGGVAARLTEWLPQVCLAFGFRLERMVVKPEYLQWTVSVPVQSPPGQMMRLVRRHTSRRLLEEFPDLRHANPSGDFWAPGYLVVNGVVEPPPSMIDEYLARLRGKPSLMARRG
jgi:REP element-mobilizing transposase RayT